MLETGAATFPVASGLGQARDLIVKSDSAGNLVVQVPATDGFEQAPIVILQGHMDMVCEKQADSDHDFSKDPIRMVQEAPG
jgi:dipeptidase D